MTKSHPMHRKKAIHMTFRRSRRVRDLYWRVTDLIEAVVKRGRKHDNKVH